MVLDNKLLIDLLLFYLFAIILDRGKPGEQLSHIVGNTNKSHLGFCAVDLRFFRKSARSSVNLWSKSCRRSSKRLSIPSSRNEITARFCLMTASSGRIADLTLSSTLPPTSNMVFLLILFGPLNGQRTRPDHFLDANDLEEA